MTDGLYSLEGNERLQKKKQEDEGGEEEEKQGEEEEQWEEERHVRGNQGLISATALVTCRPRTTEKRA